MARAPSRTNGLKVLALIVLAASMAPRLAAAQSAPLIDIGAGTASGINSSGDVSLDNGIYSNGAITPLPPLPGSGSATQALAINDSGQVAGANGCNAVIVSNGVLEDLEAPFGDAGIDCAKSTAINSGGQVAGWSGVSFSGDLASFVYENGAFTRIDSFPDSSPLFQIFSQAFGINDAGVVVGSSAYDTGSLFSFNAFIYDHGSWTNLGPGIAYAINSSGEVTGASQLLDTSGEQLSNDRHAFIYRNGVMEDLGTLDGHTSSYGLAINGGGQVVGYSESPNAGPRPFFYNGVMNDLNSFISDSDPLKPFVTLMDARGINDDRLVVVNGVDSRTALSHAYLIQGPWTDVSPGRLSFGAEPVSSVSASKSVTVTNAGALPVSIDDISVGGEYQQTNTCLASLASGASCSILVAFAPATGGDHAGTLTVVSDAYPLVVRMTGTAPITASISADPASVVAGSATTLQWDASPGSTCVATGGVAGDGWEGDLPASGSQSVTQNDAGTYQYGVSCQADSQTAQASTSITVTWPVVTASLTATPASITEGGTVTLTWNSTNATSCTANGGGASDGWPGSKSTSGSQTVVESAALAVPSVSLVFGITCTSGVSGLTAQASSTVVVNRAPSQPPRGGGGGGGGFDFVALAALGLLLASRFRGVRAWRRDPRTSWTRRTWE